MYYFVFDSACRHQKSLKHRALGSDLPWGGAWQGYALLKRANVSPRSSGAVIGEVHRLPETSPTGECAPLPSHHPADRPLSLHALKQYFAFVSQSDKYMEQ